MAKGDLLMELHESHQHQYERVDREILHGLTEFAGRMQYGCRRCGTQHKHDGLYLKGAATAKSLLEKWDANSFYASMDSTANFCLCESCLEYLLDSLNRDLKPRLADEWYIRENKKLHAQLERLRSSRRKRDARRKDARRQKSEQKRSATDPYLKLAKLDTLAEHGKTEGERSNARQAASRLRGELLTNGS